MKEDIKKELNFCMQLREQQGGCSFNKGSRCEECAAMSVLRKLYTGEVLDGQKLNLEERKKRIK